MPPETQTVDEIAKLLVQPKDAPSVDEGGKEGETSPNEGNESNEGVAEHQETDAKADSEVVGEEADDVGGDEAAEEDEDEQDNSDTDDVIEINDDDLIEVKVDGEIVYRSIADAKKALSGEGAIEKRLQEATELRKAANAERTQFLEQFALAQNQLVGVINQIQDVLFVPAVKKPPLSLRSTNPTEYLKQLDAFERDQERVNTGKAKVLELIGTQKKAFDDQVEAYRAQQGQLLAQTLPQLGDNVKGPALLKDMRDTAVNIYGYTDAEVNSASDHRLFRLVHDAMMYHKLRKGSGKVVDIKDVSGQKAKAPRKMRAGNNMRKSVVRQKATEHQQAVARAKISGKVDDIAKTLLKG